MSDMIQAWVEGVRAGNVRALSRAITAVENRTAEASSLLKGLFGASGRAQVIGLTGSPGAGLPPISGMRVSRSRTGCSRTCMPPGVLSRGLRVTDAKPWDGTRNHGRGISGSWR